MMDYVDLAKFTEHQEYIDKLLLLAEKLKSPRFLLIGKTLRFAYLMVVGKNSKTSLEYLKRNEDLNQPYFNTGIYNYYRNIGNALDSAIHYYYMAEQGMQKTFDATVRLSIYR